MRKPHIGNVRRFLFIPGTWAWNGWVRDVTARMEMWEWRVFRREL